MRIYIDADACPVVKETIELGKKFQLSVCLVCDVAHHFQFEGVEVVTVMQGVDAVDYAILNRLKRRDLVITQYYGLAALVLAKQGYAMNQKGRLYTEGNIDELLYSRYLSQKIRQSGERLKGPKKRTKEDTKDFKEALMKFLGSHV